jgi:chromosome segregation ATPase
MSTGGKVMVVLVSLMTVGWLALMSMVARLNWNYGDAVKKGEVSIEALQKQVSEAVDKLRKLEDDVETSHMVNDDDRTILRLEYNDGEKTLAEITENLSRLEGLFNQLNQARLETEKHIDVRKKEVTDDQAKLAATTKAVNESKATNASLLQKLTDLRNQFQELSEANRATSSKVGAGSEMRDVSPGAALVNGR